MGNTKCCSGRPAFFLSFVVDSGARSLHAYSKGATAADIKRQRGVRTDWIVSSWGPMFFWALSTCDVM